MNKFLISIPYIYPVCPISIDHARMFVVADIFARRKRAEGTQVFFPVAAHYSGVTAQKVCAALSTQRSANDEALANKKKTFDLFTDIYKMPSSILSKIATPEALLSFFSMQTLADLRNISVSCDYAHFYTTNIPEFSSFVSALFDTYRKKDVFVKNANNEIALNYDSEEWKAKSRENLKNVEFIQESQKANIIGAFSNIRNDWGFLRDEGIGSHFDTGQVIDPMFDSELFPVFDIYYRFKGEYGGGAPDSAALADVFAVLGGEKDASDFPIVGRVLEWLPTDLFVCEEHLKTWIVKKTYTETLLLQPKYHTRKYFITGMGSRNKERMSASRGSAILIKDLVEDYGPHNARLIILMTGGHPSKMYAYDENLPQSTANMTRFFGEFVSYLKSVCLNRRDASVGVDLSEDEKMILAYIDDGYFRQAIIHMMVIMPKKYGTADPAAAAALIAMYKRIMEFILPGFIA